MLRRGLLSIVVLVAVTLLASSANAQEDPLATVEEDGICYDMTGNAVMCSSLEEEGGGNFTSCSAVGAWGQSCWDVMQPVGGGATECVSVYRNGKCYCNEATKKTTGICTYRAR